MTRKDYVVVAKEMKAIHNHYSNPDNNNTDFLDMHNEYCNTIASVFKQDDPCFDMTKFLKACGVR